MNTRLLDPNEAHPPSTRTRVLVIDDSQTARASISSVLLGLGYDVLELASAIGATRAILRNDVRAVILDISMPGLSGDKLVNVLRSNARLSKLIVVLVSGNERGELDRLSASAGANVVLAKSAIQLELGPVLARLLSAQRRTTPR